MTREAYNMLNQVLDCLEQELADAKSQKESVNECESQIPCAEDEPIKIKVDITLTLTRK